MNKIILIISREYMTRIRKKSFIVMTLMGPIFFALLMIIPVWLATTAQDKKIISVLDHSLQFAYQLENTEHIAFHYISGTLNEAKQDFIDNGSDALLYIPFQDAQEPVQIHLFSKGRIGIRDENYLERTLGDILIRNALQRQGLDEEFIDRIRQKIQLSSIDVTQEWEEVRDVRALSAAGLGSAVLVYFFIFLYGVQVMRGVIEEKSNRIIEVIISSVKPLQLMMGKIIGIALLSLTQFIIWLSLTAAVTVITSSFIATNDLQQTPGIDDMLGHLQTINFGLMILMFLFYFLMGYLVYSAMFAAIGSMADSETDTQQFMLPVTVPLIFSFVMATTVIENPHSSLAIWLSYIPFTSPIIMMVRMPFNVPIHEVIISMVILILSFLLITWLAARIYRTGILMYGKKAGIKEVVRWVFAK
ncbi:MAG: ABC transporter permease [Cytophagaceae bacterium]